MTPETLANLDLRRLKEIEVELGTLAFAIKHAPAERQQGLADEYFRVILTMAKQKKMIGDKIASLRSARSAKAPIDVVGKRLHALAQLHAKQLKVFSKRLHQLNIELAREYSRRRSQKRGCTAR